MSSIPNNCNACGFFSDKVCTHSNHNNIIIEDSSILPELCPIKEDALDAARYRVSYRGESFYLVVSLYNGKPWEVFAEHAINSEQSLMYMMAGWDTTTRFITLALKKYPLTKVIRQLKKSSRQKNDLPGIIANVLDGYLPKVNG